MDFELWMLFLFGGLAIVIFALFAPAFDGIKTIKDALEKHGAQGLQKKIMKFGFCIMAIGFVLSLVSVYNGGGGTGSSSARCGSCGRTFSDSSSAKSIRRTGMCGNCYNNYDYLN